MYCVVVVVVYVGCGYVVFGEGACDFDDSVTV